MKKLITTILVCLCALAMIDFSRAADPNINIEWIYADPPADLAGYYLYVNDVQVQNFNVPTAVSWSGPVVLIDGNNTLEMTAYDAAGQESARSGPYTLFFDAPPGGCPAIINVTIQ